MDERGGMSQDSDKMDVMVDVKQIKNEIEADIKEEVETFHTDEETRCEDENRTDYFCGEDVGNKADISFKNECEEVTAENQLNKGCVEDMLLNVEHCGREEVNLLKVQYRESDTVQNIETFCEQNLGEKEEEEEPQFHFVDVTLSEEQEEVMEGISICRSDAGGIGVLKNCDNEEIFECIYCGKSFNERKSLQAHVSKHAQKHHYECDSCGKTFWTSSELKVHSFMHTSEFPFVCPVCNKAFRYFNSLKIHCHRHNEHTFKCEVCGDIFKGIKNLEQHKLVHSGERIYACGLCNKTFTQPSVFYRHKHAHLNERHVCPICERVFTLGMYLKRHMATHEKNRRVYVCKVCGKSFLHTSSRSRHARSHSNKRHICSVCHKTFVQLDILKNHLRTHT